MQNQKKMKHPSEDSLEKNLSSRKTNIKPCYVYSILSKKLKKKTLLGIILTRINSA